MALLRCQQLTNPCVLRSNIACTSHISGGHDCNSRNPCLRKMKFPGDPATTYNVPIRIRGVFELKDYEGGSQVPGEFFRAGGVPVNNPSNYFGIHVGQAVGDLQPAAYWFNANNGAAIWTTAADYTKTIPVKGGMCIVMIGNDVEGTSHQNCTTGSGTCTPNYVPDIAPYPDAYDGQFVQLDIDCTVALPPP